MRVLRIHKNSVDFNKGALEELFGDSLDLKVSYMTVVLMADKDGILQIILPRLMETLRWGKIKADNFLKLLKELRLINYSIAPAQNDGRLQMITIKFHEYQQENGNGEE